MDTAAIRAHLDTIRAECDAIEAELDTTTPPDPPPAGHRLVVDATKFTAGNVQQMRLDGDHWAYWGAPGETLTVRVESERAQTATVTVDYVLAAESNAVSVRAMNGTRVDFPASCATWANLARGYAGCVVNLAAGVNILEIAAVSGWLDLYGMLVESDAPVVLHVAPAPPPVVTPPPSGPADYVVGVDGTLQQIVDTKPLAGKVIAVPGVQTVGGYALNTRGKDFGGCVIRIEGVLRSALGIQMLGYAGNVTITGGVIETDGNEVFGEGIIIDATRDGNRCENIVIDGVTVRPIAGTGSIQRNGIAIWGGGGRIIVRGCDISQVAGNAYGGPGSAGSGISIGHARHSPAGGDMILVENNRVYNITVTRDGPADDRNGIILDQLMCGWDGSRWAVYPDALQGPVVVRGNTITDVAGRGIHAFGAGTSSAPVTIDGNTVSGRYAYALGGSDPKCGIGGNGLGIGSMQHIAVTGNTVGPAQPPAVDYKWIDMA